MDNTVFDKAIASIVEKSSGPFTKPEGHQITINFHPDRLTVDGNALLDSIRQDGRIKSQFVTQTSNGGLSAQPGGDRWEWESRIFANAYDNVAPAYRPKYGALNIGRTLKGGAPRFGSSAFVLKEHVNKRATFCYPDSSLAPDNFGTVNYLKPLIAMLDKPLSDPLDCYIESQVHGEILLTEDVQSIILDPIFRGSEIENQSAKLGLPILWHSGYSVDISTMQANADYRGIEIVNLASEIAKGKNIDPAILGAAYESGLYDTKKLKKVWHCLARYG